MPFGTEGRADQLAQRVVECDARLLRGRLKRVNGVSVAIEPPRACLSTRVPLRLESERRRPILMHQLTQPT